ncbi:SPRY-domain-containing protein [Hesseltinella vesiculosa]|uniref:SPRY-domain-containing protein n=1 Tax=Hesseltinella vesiculosa TaxID=101127 RepID=A0A1X2G562_9FUNG|nr:SPRY-domain-containing protein [Hesseltinella vesiculosa]
MSTYTPSTPCVDPLTTYHSAFPALQSMPWSNNVPPQKKRPSISHYSPSLAPPKPPFYLRQTHYDSLVRDQYQQHLQRRYDQHAKSQDDTQPWEADLRLPSHLNNLDKSRYLEVDKSGLSVSYVGPGRGEEHAGAVRANLPMPPQCGVYYFEMQIKSKGVDGYIGIGFCGPKNDLRRLPGWDTFSYGYHGDDGHSFEGSGTGKTYGPRFSTGDVIGCGVNFADHTAFYTKNGLSLGVAFTDIDTSKPLYPCLGMRTSGEVVTINFGQSPFAFDIAHYVKEQKKGAWQQIETQSPKVVNTKDQVHQLIFSYLMHQGYTSTANAVIKESNQTLQTQLQWDRNARGLNERLAIKAAVMRGDIDEAILLMQKHFPHLLTKPDPDGTHLQFNLDCQKFVEMIHLNTQQPPPCEPIHHDDMLVSPTSPMLEIDPLTLHSNTSGHSFVSPVTTPTTPSMPVAIHPGNSHAVPPPRRMSWAAVVAASPSSVHPPAAQPPRRLSLRRASISSGSVFSSCSSSVGGGLTSHYEWDHDDDDFITDDDEDSSEVHAIMTYGQKLQDQYDKDGSPKVRTKLKQVFSLLAYPNPKSSTMGHLLDKSQREALANQINAAILEDQQQPETPALERLFRQAIAVNKSLACLGHGESTLINLAIESLD